ncbi:MAG: FAD-dependent oxidoreductase [Gemmataceae bacterium]|nr:FAD-dependent oxidoreductase [Gemmataceae bacterium]MCI0738238.1 FAD-dependent oxidoreductase [Gemmataceae bacterium]
MRVAVIGAGPAGITAAYQLAKQGVAVEVYEASEHVGGLSRTFELWGQKVDLGPHRFFSQDPRVNELWLEVVGQDYEMVDRLTRIYYRRRFFDYPLRPGNALWNMGFLTATRCLASYFKEKIRPSYRETDTFESWVVGRFGRRLFEMFFKSYSEKLWGIPCHELDADFAAQRIKKFSLGEAVKAALGLSKGKHKTLVDQFAYPVGGTGMVYNRMADKVRGWGGHVHLRAPVQRVVHHERRVHALELKDGRIEPFDHVVSTMPLTLMVKGLGNLPAEVERAVDKLRFRNTIVVYLLVRGSNLFRDQWLYVHSPDLGTGRVTNFRNWVPEMYGDSPDTILALEYWCYDEDAEWRESDEALIERAKRDMQLTGLLGGAPILDGHVVKIRRCYPVYGRGYKQHLTPVEEYLRTFDGLSVIGRYGAFKYNNQDHSILMGLLAAENILDGKSHDLWAVNTDSEYQEAALITKTGLHYPDRPAVAEKREAVGSGV